MKVERLVRVSSVPAVSVEEEVPLEGGLLGRDAGERRASKVTVVAASLDGDRARNMRSLAEASATWFEEMFSPLSWGDRDLVCKPSKSVSAAMMKTHSELWEDRRVGFIGGGGMVGDEGVEGVVLRGRRRGLACLLVVMTRRGGQRKEYLTGVPEERTGSSKFVGFG